MVGQASGDQRVRRLLDELQLKYDVTDLGDFRLLFGFENDRSQLVFVDSNTEEYAGREIREVWAVGYVTDGPIEQSIANELLIANNNLKLGSWRVSVVNGKSYAKFAVQVAAVTEAPFLHSILFVVARTADDLERATRGKDDF